MEGLLEGAYCGKYGSGICGLNGCLGCNKGLTCEDDGCEKWGLKCCVEYCNGWLGPVVGPGCLGELLTIRVGVVMPTVD